MSDSASYHIYSDPDFVRRYEESIADNAWNAEYERPSTLSLVPEDLAGKSVLDAGCGPGIVSEWLNHRGANVTAIDYSQEMINRTQLRTNGKVACHVVDMNYGLRRFKNQEFDVIYASLVIHYIEDLTQLFQEFARILRPGGLLIFSTDHPALLAEEEPFTQRRHLAFWSGFNVSMDLFQRPWNAITNALTAARFEIDFIKDAAPTDLCAVKYPNEYKVLKGSPHFICVRAIKQS